MPDSRYHQPANWPTELVARIDEAYGRMQRSVEHHLGKAWASENGEVWEHENLYFPALLCRRCRDLACLAVRDKFGDSATPLILKFEGDWWELQRSKRQGEVSNVWTERDVERIGAEQTIVHKFAVKYLTELSLAETVPPKKTETEKEEAKTKKKKKRGAPAKNLREECYCIRKQYVEEKGEKPWDEDMYDWMDETKDGKHIIENLKIQKDIKTDKSLNKKMKVITAVQRRYKSWLNVIRAKFKAEAKKKKRP